MSTSKNTDQNNALVAAIQKSQSIIEFNMDGTIITANDNFLSLMGYSLSELQGKHHRIFCSKDYSESAEYQAFWDKMNQGQFDTGEYIRLGKNGDAVYIQASYNPILDKDGQSS
jgi:methyl-accepting chemotaxis protein